MFFCARAGVRGRVGEVSGPNPLTPCTLEQYRERGVSRRARQRASCRGRSRYLVEKRQNLVL